MATDAVPVYTLDGIGLNRCPTLLKIDVEGMELAVLRGARATIARCRPVLFFENNCVRGSRDILAFATSPASRGGLGMECHWVVEPYFNAGNFFGNATSIFPDEAWPVRRKTCCGLRNT